MKETKILIVTDAQNDFCDGALGTKEAQASVPFIVGMINSFDDGDVIIATKDTHGADYLDTSEGRHLPVPHTIHGTKGWEIVPEIAEALEKHNAVYLLKDRFGSLDLASMVRANVFTREPLNVVRNGKGMSIYIVGWCTDICVISNALLLKAEFPEAKITVDAACCAGVTPEAHNAALTVLRSCQVEVV